MSKLLSSLHDVQYSLGKWLTFKLAYLKAQGDGR